ncbi:MAG: class I SAM-dependent methyltransferase [Gemmatimonadaceae bacterium]
MTESVGYYDTTYRQHMTAVMAKVRRETYGEDIGQNSWLTVAELRGFLEWMDVTATDHLLEIACGSGGPGCYVAQTTGCRLTGLDNNAEGVANAQTLAHQTGVADRTRWIQADANERLPFADAEFDALLCIDALNHLRDRQLVLREWTRVLRPGGVMTFTDPVVVTGAVNNSELAVRSSIGFFLFVPPGYTERLIEEAGLRLIRVNDGSDNAATISERRRAARQRVQDELARIEGPSTFEGVQAFLQVVHDLTASGRLSRYVYHATKP